MGNTESEKNLSGIKFLVSESVFNLIESLGGYITLTKNAEEALKIFTKSGTETYDAIILASEEAESVKNIPLENKIDSERLPVIAIKNKNPDKDELTISILKNLYKFSSLRIKRLEHALDCINKDGLTGVNNRMSFENFEDKITQEIVDNKISSFAIIIFDINNLKNTNDLLGHDAGDQLIIDGCKIICDTFKHSPVFRVGGDEFVAFLQGEDFKNRKCLLSGFQKKMNKEYFISGAVSIASGMSDFIPQKDINVADVFKRADEDMYRTKAKMKKQGV